jgi:hypothetical protein
MWKLVAENTVPRTLATVIPSPRQPVAEMSTDRECAREIVFDAVADTLIFRQWERTPD